MIKFNNINQEIPYKIFEEKYNKSLQAQQKNIEAICISSYSKEKSEVNARFVNLKFIDNKEFIFFSNYKSPKSQDFTSHNQITGLIYWSSIDVQIRIKANIKRTSKKYNQAYFSKRSSKKNALAISSNQSSVIKSYASVENEYKKTLKNKNLNICPDYWGGYSFTPYYFEFWQGHEFRLNKREAYELNNSQWMHSYLEP